MKKIKSEEELATFKSLTLNIKSLKKPLKYGQSDENNAHSNSSEGSVEENALEILNRQAKMGGILNDERKDNVCWSSDSNYAADSNDDEEEEDDESLNENEINKVLTLVF